MSDSSVSAAWRRLTSQTVKHDVYAAEPYMARAWSEAVEQFGDQAAWILQRTAAALFRPDAIVAARLHGAIGYIEDRLGLVPVFCAPVDFTEQSAELVWKYQWGGASADRIALMKSMLTSAPSVLVAFRDPRARIELPASVRLSAVKGSGHPAERAGHELRSALGSPNRVLTFVHITDEPADILREAAILLPPAERRRMFAALRDDGAPLDRRLLPGGSAGISLDGREALERILARVAAAPVADPAAPARERLVAALEAAARGSRLDWIAFRRGLDECDIRLPLWDQLVAGAAYIDYDNVMDRAIIPNSGYRGWLDAAGLVLADPYPAPRRPRDAG